MTTNFQIVWCVSRNIRKTLMNIGSRYLFVFFDPFCPFPFLVQRLTVVDPLFQRNKILSICKVHFIQQKLSQRVIWVKPIIIVIFLIISCHFFSPFLLFSCHHQIHKFSVANMRRQLSDQLLARTSRLDTANLGHHDQFSHGQVNGKIPQHSFDWMLPA